MIEAIINASICNRYMVLVFAVLLAVWGVTAVDKTPIDAIPDLSDVQVIIKTTYAGQAPQVVEDQITYPLTTAMLAVPGAVNVRGYSFFNDSYVYVIFEDGTDIYWARSRVLEYLSQVAGSLPEEAKPVLGPDATGVGWVYQYALVDKSGTHDLAQLRSLQDWFLKYELQALKGVAEVATIGGMVKQYQVVVNPNSLRAHNVSLDHVRKAIANGNQEMGGRVIEMAEAEYMVRASGYITSIEDLENIPLKVSETGTPVLLKDVSDIRFGPELRRGVGELNGEGEAVGGVVIMRFGENAKDTIFRVKQKLEQLKTSLPAGVDVVTTYDRSSLIERAVDTLKTTLLEELLIVTLVCALFLLHMRSSLVVLISLPFGVLIAFIVMQLMDISANIMSLGGIAIAIGTMVDATIVMIENFHKHLERKDNSEKDRWDILAVSAREVGPSLFFSLVIITLSFAPIFVLEAQEGRMFHPLAYTKSFAMAAAALLSITLVPVLIGVFVRGKVRPEKQNPVSQALISGYRPFIHFALTRPKTIMVGALLIMASAIVPMNRIGSEFMPELDEGDLLYMPSAYPAISIGKATQILQQTNKLIKSLPEVETVYGKAGRADTATDPAPLTMIETTIRLKPRSQWRDGMTMNKLKLELDQLVNVPSMSNVWIMPIKNRIDMLSTGIKTPVGVKIAGPDLNVIATIGEEIENIIGKVEGTTSVYAERVTGGRYVNIEVNRLVAARYGMNISDVQGIVKTAIGGTSVTRSVEGLERYPVNLRYPQDFRDSLDKLENMPVVTQTGAIVPLGHLADISIQNGPGVIRSENARLNGWVYIDIQGRDIGTYVQAAKRAVAAHIDLPTGYSLHWSGQFEYMERAIDKLKTVVPITLIIIMILLFMNFKRLSSVAIIMGTLPMALVGGFWLIDILNYNMSVAVGVGFIALAGVTVETGVLMIVYIEQALKDAQIGKTTLDDNDIKTAIAHGALSRVRPILMTVMSTIIGLMPILLGTGTGSEVMSRIAAPMVGGMISSTALTLVVIPALYYLWKKKSLL